MPNQPSPFTPQPPPELPNDPQISNQLSNYLRTFSLWCRRGFAAKLDKHSALPGILLQANDAPAGAAPKIFMLQVTTAGTVVVTAVPLGGGAP